jgi:hypothetical protein
LKNLTAKIMKTFIVNIDKKYSEDIMVQAKNSREAKKLAFEKFAKKKLKPKDFSIYADEV